MPITSEGLDALESYRMFYNGATTWEGEEGAMSESESLEYAVIRPWDAQYYYYDFQTTDPNTIASPWVGYQFGEEFFELDILPEGNLCYRDGTRLTGLWKKSRSISLKTILSRSKLGI